MGKANINGQEITFNDDYSFGNFSNQDLAHFDDLRDMVIYSSQFYWEKPNSRPFPAQATGLTFINCNLDNIVMPPDAIIQNCSQRNFKDQNDGEDWFVDGNGLPTAPINLQLYLDLGVSTNPADIPSHPLSQSILISAEQNKG